MKRLNRRARFGMMASIVVTGPVLLLLIYAWITR